MSISTEQSPSRSPGALSSWWKPFKKTQNSSNDSFQDSPNFVRPFNLKSRSFTSARPATNEEEIRQQRDQFISTNKPFELGNQIFGVPLQDSIDVADSLISVPSDDPNDFIRYGKIPLLIGKCGSHLKEKGLSKEGIFRVAGSSRRVKELQYIFSTSPDYGRKMSWDGYTVHDAASIFRRYLNNLPEPLVPLDLYDAFRKPVSTRPKIISHIQARNDTIEKRLKFLQKQRQLAAAGNTGELKDQQTTPITDDEADLSPEELAQKKQDGAKKQKKIAKEIRYALKEYRVLIDNLPIANKHLLYYLLDMLNMFSEHAKDNLMSARNLAAIFQPSILSHPDHDLNPDEYALSQAVVELLIEYSKRVLPDIKNDKKEKKSKKKAVGTAEDKKVAPKLEVPEITTTNADWHDSANASSNGEAAIKKAIKKAINHNHNSLPKVTSNVNLKVYRNDSFKNRPHSRSLSSATGIPDHIKRSSLFASRGNSHTDQEESSDEEEHHELNYDSPVISPLAQPQLSSDDTPDNTGLTPTQEISKLDIFSPSTNPTSTSMVSSLSKLNTSSIEHPNVNVAAPKDRKRPVSMFPTGGAYNTSTPLDFEKEDRPSRWLHAGSNNDQTLGLSPPAKKENWFNRLRSSSRGKNKP